MHTYKLHHVTLRFKSSPKTQFLGATPSDSVATKYAAGFGLRIPLTLGQKHIDDIAKIFLVVSHPPCVRQDRSSPARRVQRSSRPFAPDCELRRIRKLTSPLRCLSVNSSHCNFQGSRIDFLAAHPDLE